MPPNLINDSWEFRKSVAFTGPLFLPSGAVEDSHVTTDPNKRIAATKAVHQFTINRESFGESTTISAINQWLHSVRGSTGYVAGLEASTAVQATGADRTVTIDLQKSTGAGSFATILSAPLEIDNTTPIRTPQAATISDTDLVDGDILRVVITVAGSAGAQALCLIVSLHLREDPE